MTERFAPTLSNFLFDSSQVSHYLGDYAKAVQEALSKVDPYALQSAFELMLKVLEEGKSIYVAGNGGSASIANHLCCDWTKGTCLKESPALRTFSLASNSALMTALANDADYSQVFSAQLEFFAQKRDLCIIISSSGSSANVLRLARQAGQMGVHSIGMTGFSGGELSKLVDVNLHVPANNYGVVEDGHQALMHVLAQFLAIHREKNKKRL